MFFSPGDFLQCSLGGAVGAFVSYGWCTELNCGVALVVCKGRKCIWPIHVITAVS